MARFYYHSTTYVSTGVRCTSPPCQNPTELKHAALCGPAGTRNPIELKILRTSVGDCGPPRPDAGAGAGLVLLRDKALRVPCGDGSVLQVLQVSMQAGLPAVLSTTGTGKNGDAHHGTGG